MSDAVGHIEGRLLRALARVEQVQSSEAFVRAILDVTRGELAAERERARLRDARLRRRSEERNSCPTWLLDRLAYRVEMANDPLASERDRAFGCRHAIVVVEIAGPKPGRFLP